MSLFKSIKSNLKESSTDTFKEFKDWFYTEFPNSTLYGDWWDSDMSTTQKLKELYNDYKSGDWYTTAIKSQGYEDTYSNSLKDYEKYLSDLLNYDNDAHIWVIPYPFESGDKVEYNGNKYTVNFVEYKAHLNDYGVDLLDKNGDDLADPKYGNYIPCKEVKLVSKKLKESESTSNNIEYAEPNYTGGGIYTYSGKLSDGNYFMAEDSDFDREDKSFMILFVDEDPSTAIDPETGEELAWFWDEWQKPHLVKALDFGSNEARAFTKQLLKWIIKNKPDGNYAVEDMEKMLDVINSKE